MTTRTRIPDSGPALRLLSLDAGVQSTTVLLLACEGVIPRFDVALFADTGWATTIAAGNPPHGTVLDPFSGAATTGMAAHQLGRTYIGIDLNERFHDIGIRRLNNQSSTQRASHTRDNAAGEAA